MAIPYNRQAQKYYSAFESYNGTVRYSASPSVLVSWDNQAVFAKNTNRLAFYKANGYLPIQPYTASFRKVTQHVLGVLKNSGAGGTQIVQSDFRVLYNIGLGGSWVLASTDSRWSALRARAIARANSQVRSQYVGLGEAFAEGSKTVNMFSNAARTIATAARSIRRGRFQQAAAQLGLSSVPSGVKKGKRNFANNWLEYRYGWLPVLSTLHGGMVALWEFQRERPILHFVRGRQSDVVKPGATSVSYDPSWTNGDFNLSCGMYYKVWREPIHTISYEVGYIYKISDETVTKANSLGLLDPLLLTWELVPYSFVVDWFVNVGDVLEQITAFSGKTFISGWETRTCRTTTRAYAQVTNWNASSGWSKSWITQPKAERTDTWIERKVLTSPPVFGLHLSNGLNLTRVVDGVSLLKQAFSRRSL